MNNKPTQTNIRFNTDDDKQLWNDCKGYAVDDHQSFNQWILKMMRIEKARRVDDEV